MHFSTSDILVLALSASVASAAPYYPVTLKDPITVPFIPFNSSVTTTAAPAQTPVSFPLANGFPDPSNEAQIEIELEAGGTLSNAPPPSNPGRDALTNLQLVAFNELFEVAFYTDLLVNITTFQSGFEIEDEFEFNFTVDALTAIQSQESLHTLNANKALEHFGLDPIEPCEYIFPVDNFPDAIALAATFTDLVMGTLQDVQAVFTNANASGLVRGIGSVIGQEGEQEGFFRIIQNKRPSSAAFLTTSVRDFAFTALQGFTVPGSCPSLGEIPLNIFGTLNVLNAKDLTNKNGTAQFRVNSTQAPISSSDSVVYISGQNLPVTVPIANYYVNGVWVTFDAEFPFEGFQGNGTFNEGLTIAAVVPGNTQFSSADEVALATSFGPGLFEIN